MIMLMMKMRMNLNRCQTLWMVKNSQKKSHHQRSLPVLLAIWIKNRLLCEKLLTKWRLPGWCTQLRFFVCSLAIRISSQRCILFSAFNLAPEMVIEKFCNILIPFLAHTLFWKFYTFIFIFTVIFIVFSFLPKYFVAFIIKKYIPVINFSTNRTRDSEESFAGSRLLAWAYDWVGQFHCNRYTALLCPSTEKVLESHQQLSG